MDLFTIILFFLYIWGFGFSARKILKQGTENILEDNLMNLGFGIAIFIVVGVTLNLLHIPLDWRIFLLLSISIPLFYLFKYLKEKKIPKLKFQFTKSNIYIFIILILFAFTFYMYHTGAFAYPYLEDDDPWSHALGAKYVSIEKTVFVNQEAKANDIFNYIDAYPPAYDMLMGILHQTSKDMMWTLKFFNALIISLSIIFFYFFVKSFTGSSGKALFSTFALAMIPCYLSHFIWAHSLIPLLFFVSIYCLEKAKSFKKYYILFSLTIAAICLTQPSQPIKLGVMFVIYWVVKSFIQKKWNISTISSIFAGYVLAVILWWVPMFIKYGSNILTIGLKWSSGGESLLVEKSGVIGPIGSATRFYNFNDFFIAKSQNMINNPVGVGIVLFLLMVIGIILIVLNYKSLKEEKNHYKIILFLWFVFTLCGLYGGTVFPIALESFMFWMLLAIPISILAGEAIWFLFSLGKQFKVGLLLVIIIFLGIWSTSGHQKFEVNTAQWGPGGWLGPAPGSIYSFLWMNQNLPIDTNIFVFSLLKGFPIGWNLYSCEWCPDVIKFREGLQNKSVEDVHLWLKQNKYEYAMIDEYYIKDVGVNQTNDMINKMTSSNLYNIVYQADDGKQKLPSLVLKIN